MRKIHLKRSTKSQGSKAIFAWHVQWSCVAIRNFDASTSKRSKREWMRPMETPQEKVLATERVFSNSL